MPSAQLERLKNSSVQVLNCHGDNKTKEKE